MGGTVCGLTTEDGIFRVATELSYGTLKVNESLTNRWQGALQGEGAARRPGLYSNSSNGTMVDFTVFMAIACATASLTPSTVNGNSVCILRQGYLARAL
jgi:hypothetical protein